MAFAVSERQKAILSVRRHIIPHVKFYKMNPQSNIIQHEIQPWV